MTTSDMRNILDKINQNDVNILAENEMHEQSLSNFKGRPSKQNGILQPKLAYRFRVAFHNSLLTESSAINLMQQVMNIEKTGKTLKIHLRDDVTNLVHETIKKLHNGPTRIIVETVSGCGKKVLSTICHNNCVLEDINYKFNYSSDTISHYELVMTIT